MGLYWGRIAADVFSSQLPQKTDSQNQYDKSCLKLSRESYFEVEKSGVIDLIQSSSGDYALVAEVRLQQPNKLLVKLGEFIRDKIISDQELVLASYRRWGTECVHHLFGEFSFIIVDRLKKRLFFARDRLGIQPFFYHQNTSGYYFSNSMEKLCQLTKVSSPQAINFTTLSHHLDISTAGLSDTWLINHHRLKPAHTLIISNDNRTVNRYWNPHSHINSEIKTSEDWSEQIKTTISNSVEDCCGAEDLTAAHLTGGLDSSAIIALASQHHNSEQTLTGFSWRCPPKQPIDLIGELIEQLQRRYPVTPKYPSLSQSHILRALKLDPLKNHVDDTLLYEYEVMSLAKQNGIKTILSGWGGDQAISNNGRGVYPELLLSGKWPHLFQIRREFGASQPILSGLFQAMLPLLPVLFQSSIKRVLMQNNGRNITKSYLHPDLRKSYPPPRLGFQYRSVADVIQSHLSKSVARLESWHAYGTKFEVNYRYPLLDQRVIELALSIPATMWIQSGYTRYMMRSAMQTLLPDDVCWNRDKSDDYGTESLDKSLLPLLVSLGKTLKHNKPSRANYLDWDRLMGDLTETRLASGQVGMGRLIRAIQFLDI